MRHHCIIIHTLIGREKEKSNMRTHWKRIFALALTATLCLGLLTACGGSGAGMTRLDEIRAKGVLTIATSPDYAPNEFVDSSKTGQDQYVGLDMSLARYIAQEMGVELNIQAMGFDACQTAVSLGSVDAAISGFAPTDKRRENYEMSDPFHASTGEINQILLIRASDADKYKTAEDFDGVVVGAQNGSLQMQLLTNQLPNAVSYTVGQLGTGVMELQAGNIEALAIPYTAGQLVLKNNPDLMQCEWYFDYKSVGTVVLMTKGETQLCAAINEILAKAESEGLIEEWYNQALDDAQKASAIEVTIPDEPAQ